MTENQGDATDVPAGAIAYAAYLRRVAAWFIDVLLIFAVFFRVAVSLRFAFCLLVSGQHRGRGRRLVAVPSTLEGGRSERLG
jgi:hypothetical protein